MCNSPVFLTNEEKCKVINEWQKAYNDCIDFSEIGTPDKKIIKYVDMLNTLNGLCVVQSCSGHKEGEKKVNDGYNAIIIDGIKHRVVPTRLWLRLSMDLFYKTVEPLNEFCKNSFVDNVSILYGREKCGIVLEIVYKTSSENYFNLEYLMSETYKFFKSYESQ